MIAEIYGFYPLTFVHTLVVFDRMLGVQQAVQMDDDVFDVGFIDAGLAGAAPRPFRRITVGKDADDIEPIRIDEIRALGVFDLPAKTRCKSGLSM